MVSVVGDDRSGDPLHERCDESDVYKGKVAQVGMVPDLVGRLNTLADRKSTIFGTSQFTDEVTFSNTFYPTII